MCYLHLVAPHPCVLLLELQSCSGSHFSVCIKQTNYCVVWAIAFINSQGLTLCTENLQRIPPHVQRHVHNYLTHVFKLL